MHSNAQQCAAMSKIWQWQNFVQTFRAVWQQSGILQNAVQYFSDKLVKKFDVSHSSLNQKKQKTRHHVKLHLIIMTWAIIQLYSLQKAPHARRYLSISHWLLRHFVISGQPRTIWKYNAVSHLICEHPKPIPSIPKTYKLAPLHTRTVIGWSKGNLDGSCGGDGAVIEKRTRYGEVVILKC